MIITFDAPGCGCGCDTGIHGRFRFKVNYILDRKLAYYHTNHSPIFYNDVDASNGVSYGYITGDYFPFEFNLFPDFDFETEGGLRNVSSFQTIRKIWDISVVENIATSGHFRAHIGVVAYNADADVIYEREFVWPDNSNMVFNAFTEFPDGMASYKFYVSDGSENKDFLNLFNYARPIQGPIDDDGNRPDNSVEVPLPGIQVPIIDFEIPIDPGHQHLLFDFQVTITPRA